jgi:hypothetical protein
MVTTIRKSLSEGAAADSADEGGSSAQPTGFATLKGTFRLDGQPPEPVALSITKDESVCAPGGKAVFAHDLVVDSATKGIANVLVYLDTVPPDWIHESAKPGKTDEVVFDQKECIFLTHVVAMQTSQKLRILNSDPVGHNTAVANFNQTIPSQGVAIFQPLKELRSPVKMSCAVHPWMQAWFINRDNSYFAVTAPDGSFTIANLPAGVPLEFRVWQEKSGPVKQATLNDSKAALAKGKLKVTLEPDEQRELELVLSSQLFQ